MSKASGEKNLEAQEKKNGKTAAKTTVKKAAAKTTAKAAAAKTAVKEAVKKTAEKAAAKKTAEKAAVKKTAAKPAVKKTAAKPAAKKTTAKTAVKKAAAKTTVKAAAAKKAVTKTAEAGDAIGRGYEFIHDLDQYLYDKGVHYDIFKKLGAHPSEKGGVKGVHFAVWAPHAAAVHLIGEFNGWDEGNIAMERLDPSGIWECFLADAQLGQMYKYLIYTADGRKLYKADPYANQAEKRPGTASVIADIASIRWTDSVWMKKRASFQQDISPLPEPVRILPVDHDRAIQLLSQVRRVAAVVHVVMGQQDALRLQLTAFEILQDLMRIVAGINDVA